MKGFVALAAFADFVLLVFLAVRVFRGRHEGASLRLRIFGALATATLVGAFLTGTYAIAEQVAAEAHRTGLGPIATRIAPKAFLLGSALLLFSAAAAAEVGRRLARSVEELTQAASRIAAGELTTPLPRGHGREARQLARALTSMRTELEGRPYAAAFLRDAWHDLKTPAAALKATIEVLADGALDDPTVARKFLENLRQSSDQLERTLDDLVTLARFETATLAPDEWVSLNEVLSTALERVRPLAEATGVTLQSPITLEAVATRPESRDLRGDPAALQRTWTNVLENAVIATPGGLVSLVVERGRDGFHIDVINEPASVPSAVRTRLFERAATSRHGHGSGLGLAIARAAVEAHGGRIRFVELGPPRVCVRVELPKS